MDSPCKKLLVLDVNGLLVDTYFYRGSHPKEQPDAKIGSFFVYKRPYCDEFVRFCLENFLVGIWSSARQHNVVNMVDYIFGEAKSKLAFIWHQLDCTDTGIKAPENRQKPVFLKELSKLWSNLKLDLPWKKGDYGPANTLLVDDTPYKALRNPPNTAIFPRPYTVCESEDNVLGGALRAYLEGVCDALNVQQYVESNPFGEPRITTKSSIWSYFSQFFVTDAVNEEEFVEADSSGTPAFSNVSSAIIQRGNAEKAGPPVNGEQPHSNVTLEQICHDEIIPSNSGRMMSSRKTVSDSSRKIDLFVADGMEVGSDAAPTLSNARFEFPLVEHADKAGQMLSEERLLGDGKLQTRWDKVIPCNNGYELDKIVLQSTVHETQSFRENNEIYLKKSIDTMNEAGHVCSSGHGCESYYSRTRTLENPNKKQTRERFLLRSDGGNRFSSSNRLTSNENELVLRRERICSEDRHTHSLTESRGLGTHRQKERSWTAMSDGQVSGHTDAGESYSRSRERLYVYGRQEESGLSGVLKSDLDSHVRVDIGNQFSSSNRLTRYENELVLSSERICSEDRYTHSMTESRGLGTHRQKERSWTAKSDGPVSGHSDAEESYSRSRERLYVHGRQEESVFSGVLRSDLDSNVRVDTGMKLSQPSICRRMDAQVEGIGRPQVSDMHKQNTGCEEGERGRRTGHRRKLRDSIDERNCGPSYKRIRDKPNIYDHVRDSKLNGSNVAHHTISRNSSHRDRCIRDDHVRDNKLSHSNFEYNTISRDYYSNTAPGYGVHSGLDNRTHHHPGLEADKRAYFPGRKPHHLRNSAWQSNDTDHFVYIPGFGLQSQLDIWSCHSDWEADKRDHCSGREPPHRTTLARERNDTGKSGFENGSDKRNNHEVYGCDYHERRNKESSSRNRGGHEQHD